MGCNAGFDLSISNKKRLDELVSSEASILFANFDARFTAELGLPTAQGWVASNTSVFNDNIFGVERDSIKFTDGSAEHVVNATMWQNALTHGMSFSSVLRFEERTSSNSIFSGVGFPAVDDPRTGTGISGRVGLQINIDTENTRIKLEGQATVPLDGTNGVPLVPLNTFFTYECVLHQTPDLGVSFGAVNLYVNGVLISTGSIFPTGNNDVANNKVAIFPWSETGSSTYYISNLGITIYKESSTKLLSGEVMGKGAIDIVTPGGIRDYEAIIPDGFPRKLGDTFRLIANNSGGTFTFRTEDLNNPQALFNGLKSLEMHIESKEQVTLTNLLESNNIYQGVLPHERPSTDLINIEIFENGELETYATAGVITVDSSMTFTFKSEITTDVSFNVVEGANLVIRGYGMYPLVWTGAGTFITSVLAPMHIQDITLIAVNNGTLLDLSGDIDTHVVFNFCVCIDWNIGSVYNIPTSPIAPQFYIEYSVFFGWTGGLVCTNTTDVGITDCTLLQAGVSANEPFITMNGSVPVGLYSAGTTGSMEAGESFLSIDAQIANNSRIQIASQSLKGNYFETNGTTGTFTEVADASIPNTFLGVSSGTNGVVRFAYAGALFINQEVIIGGYTVNTNYNGTFTITDAQSNWFEIAVAFGAMETGGSFIANSITLTDVGTTLVDGDTLTIEASTESGYDGGAIIYNQLVNSFQVSKTFTSNDIGIWNTSGLDQSDPRVLSSNNPSQASSKYIGAGYMNGNTVSNTVGSKPITNGAYTDLVLGGVGISKASNIERWKVIDPVLCILEYIGNEPFTGFIDYNLSSVSVGGSIEFRYKWVIDKGTGYQDLSDNKYSKNVISTTTLSTSDKIPLAVVQGDRVKPQITRMTGSSTHIAEDFSVSITAS